MDKNVISHLEAVRQWLSDNVVKIDDAAAIAVVDITYDPQTFRGCFVITADGVLLDGEWRFWLGDADGHTHISPPMFISPLGAPASYEAVEISDEQFASVLAQIRAVFPRIAPLGKRFTFLNSTVADRIIDWQAYEDTIARLPLPGDASRLTCPH